MGQAHAVLIPKPQGLIARSHSMVAQAHYLDHSNAVGLAAKGMMVVIVPITPSFRLTPQPPRGLIGSLHSMVALSALFEKLKRRLASG